MANARDISPGMQVLGSDGGMVGRVIGLHADHIHVEPDAPEPGSDHIVPRAWVARVDDHVHLDRDAALVRDTWRAGDGHSAPGHGTAHEAAHSGMGRSWIVWLIGALLLILVIILGVRGCFYAASDTNLENGPAVDAPAA